MEGEISVKNLSVGYNWGGGLAPVIKDLNLDISQGIIFGIAGESGSGKSTLAQALFNSLKYPGEIISGEVIYDGKDLLKMPKNQLRRIRGVEMSLIPQAAMNALNPVKRIGDQFDDVFIGHGIDPDVSSQKVDEVLTLVRLNRNILKNYPHELSGGMKQRVVIAMALVLSPRLVILDEPTTGLDVLVEHDILVDLKSIQRKRQFTMIIITHDLSILYEISDQIAMMYSGEITECGDRDLMLNDPAHPYNYLLLKSIPRIGMKRYNGVKLKGMPANYNPAYPGCQFCSRCPYMNGECESNHPDLAKMEGENHYYRCLRYPDWKE